jgi:predicted dehydrogenase
MWRIGILSATGTARKRTVPALRGSSLCQVTVVHGRSLSQLRQTVGVDADIRLATSEQEFAELRQYYDVIFIASPPFLHPSHIELAIHLGMPVICEKPLIVQRDSFGPLMAKITESGIPFMLAHHIRHQPAIAEIAEIVKRGRFGAPVAANLQWCFMMNHAAPSALWKLDGQLGGSNAMFDCGVHAIDTAVHLFGKPARVSATGYHLRSADTWDSAIAVLQYSNFSATVVASQSASSVGNDLRITFQECVLQASGFFGEKAVQSVEIVGSSGGEKLIYGSADLYRTEVEDFCRSLERGETIPGTTAADAAACSRILFAIEDAIQTGNSVEIDWEPNAILQCSAASGCCALRDLCAIIFRLRWRWHWRYSGHRA